MLEFFRKDAFLPKLFTYMALYAAGLVNVFGYAPHSLWGLPIVTLAFAVLLVQAAKSSKQALSYGFVYGLGWFSSGISWVHVAIAEFGGLPIWASIFVMLLLVAYLALYPALAFYLTKRFETHIALWSFPLFWLIAETLREHVLTGFPWLALGYSQLEGPMRETLPIFGATGMQVLVAVLAVSIATLISWRAQNLHHRLLSCSFIVFTFSLALVSQLMSSTSQQQPIDKTFRVALVQGNIAQSMKWQPENELPTMNKYLSMSSSLFDNHDVIIWPEAAIPRLEVLSNEFLREVDRLAAETNTGLVTGIVDYQPETDKAYNNIIALGKKYADDKFGHYRYLHNNRFNKHHLLPIGEFIPLESWLRNLAPLFNLPMSSFSRGHYQQDNLIVQGVRMSPAICFEIAFANQVRANLYPDSDVILTVSNDAWFGDSHGPWQHLQIAQMRALEFGKPVIRVTNNGVTAIIDNRGHVVSQLPQFEAAVLSHTVEVSRSETVYQVWGNYIAWLLAFMILGFAAVVKRLVPTSLSDKQS